MASGSNIGGVAAGPVGTNPEGWSQNSRPGACSAAFPADRRQATRSTETVRGRYPGPDACRKAVESTPCAGEMQRKSGAGTVVEEAIRRTTETQEAATSGSGTWREPK